MSRSTMLAALAPVTRPVMLTDCPARISVEARRKARRDDGVGVVVVGLVVVGVGVVGVVVVGVVVVVAGLVLAAPAPSVRTGPSASAAAAGAARISATAATATALCPPRRLSPHLSSMSALYFFCRREATNPGQALLAGRGGEVAHC
ncbi:MAG: hypothetical protein ACYC91_01710 [Solirubrobacteraceae bacterium]